MKFSSGCKVKFVGKEKTNILKKDKTYTVDYVMLREDEVFLKLKEHDTYFDSANFLGPEFDLDISHVRDNLLKQFKKEKEKKMRM